MMEAIAKYESLQVPALSPQEQVNKASEMAQVLQGVVNQAGLSKKFGGQKEHLFFEAWQTIGQFFQCTPVTEWTKAIKDGESIVGYEARVNVVNGDGRIIATAESMCMRDEPNWKNKPLYAMRSMAQTRTAGKALRSVFAWVAVLAGYSGTPAEEMDVEFVKSDPEPNHVSPDKRTEERSNMMTDKQRKKLWAMMKEATLSNEEASSFFDWYSNKTPLTLKQASEFIEGFDLHLKRFQEREEDDIPI